MTHEYEIQIMDLLFSYFVGGGGVGVGGCTVYSSLGSAMAEGLN